MTPKPTATATDYLPGNFSTMQSKLVYQDKTKKTKKIKAQKNSQTFKKGFLVLPEVFSPLGSGCRRRGQHLNRHSEL